MHQHQYKNIYLLTALLCLWTFSTLAQADAVIKKNYMKHGSVHYFKANAQEITLGVWGEKHTPIGQANYLDREGSLEKVIDDVLVTRFKMSQSGSSKADVLANFSIEKLGLGISGHDFYEKLSNHEYEFLEISIANKNKFKNDLNKKPNLINDLKQRDDHRIVTSVIIVISGKEATKMGITHQGSVSGTWNGMKLTVNTDVGNTSDRTYEPAPGSTYAYMLDKMKWDAVVKEKRTKILDLTDDQHGLY